MLVNSGLRIMLWLDKIYAIYKIKYSLIFWHGCKTLLIAQYKKKTVPAMIKK